MNLREQMKDMREVSDKDRVQSVLQQSQRKLMKTIETKIRTSFIAAIAQFEEKFGEAVWGHGKLDEEKSDRQKAWEEVWNEARTNILNHGNNQLRAALAEIAQYDVKWNRYQLNLVNEKEGK